MTNETTKVGTEEEETTNLQESSDSTNVATEEVPDEKSESGEEPKKLQQKVEISDIGPCKKHVKVTIDRADVEKKLDEKFSELVKEAIVPGFRKGKTPRRVIEKQFHKDVADQVKSEIVIASLEQLADGNEIAALSPPDLDPSKIDMPKDGPLVYEFNVEVRPEFELPDYRGMKIKRPVRTITDQDVEREQRRILAQYGQIIPKEGAVEPEDYVIVDMTTQFRGQVIGKVEEVTLRVANRLAFKDGIAEKFADQLVGAKAGDTREVDITMADHVARPDLAGQKVQATLQIKDVKTLRLPELTHEFLHVFGVHSEDQLRELIYTALQRRLEYQQRQSARRQVLEHIESAQKLELPQDLLVNQARRTLRRRALEMQEAGMSADEIQGRLRIIQQDILKSTADSLKEHFVLQKIAELEKIEVDDDEINAEIEAMADEQGISPRRMRAQLEKEDALESLATLLIERKALNLILENAVYEDVPLDAPEESVTVSEEQAVPGEIRDVVAEAEKEQKESKVKEEQQPDEAKEADAT